MYIYYALLNDGMGTIALWDESMIEAFGGMSLCGSECCWMIPGTVDPEAD